MPIQNLIPISAGAYTSDDFVIPPSHKAVILLKWPPGRAQLHSMMRLEQRLIDGSYDEVAVLRGGLERHRYVVDTPGTYRLYRYEGILPSGADIVLGTDYAGQSFDPGHPVYSTQSGIYGFDFEDNEFQRLESRGQRLVTVQDGWSESGSGYERLMSREQRSVVMVDTQDISSGNTVRNLRTANNRLIVRVDGESFSDATILGVTFDDVLTPLPSYSADYIDISNPSDTLSIAYTRAGSTAEAVIPPLTSRRVVLPDRTTASISIRNATDATSMTLGIDAVRRTV